MHYLCTIPKLGFKITLTMISKIRIVTTYIDVSKRKNSSITTQHCSKQAAMLTNNSINHYIMLIYSMFINKAL